MITNKHFNFDDAALIIVFLISYFVSMYIQMNDPDIKLNRPDWIIGFLSSFVGGYVAYQFCSFTTDNPGEVMFYSILASVVSPKAFKILVNHNVQEKLIKGFLSGILNAFSKNKDTDDRNI